LPLIASKLPLSIPTPTLIGKPAADYPWPFTGYVVLAGTVLSAVRAPERAYREVASALGTFLRVLHRLDLGPLTRAGLQGDKIGRLDRERMMPKLRERLEYLQSVGVVSEAGSIANFAVGIAPEKRHAEPTAVVHGDLYARHILVNDEYEPIGIIDWGDVHFGDPAVDLSIAYSLIPPRERPVFFDAYGRIDDRTMESARYRALYHSAMVAHYGHRIGDSDLVYVGITGLRNASS
jgi:aminoglycoside phosphotransferase (APT) family kinase protein